jgi:TolB-like protein/tetratricopeptide (TPR) repeat protein/tRNA A-37 threonylcarbamoyl transferase component Bud32
MRLSTGARLGPYEVVALLGAGGMAEVYRARDTRLGREVAIKVVSESLGTDGTFVERFEREARLVGSVSHPNVVALHDVGVHDGKPYFVTELLQGQTLRTRLADGPVPLATALDWAMQMAEGLAAAHERGIVHRDLKPENVLLSRDRHIKLLDFGIAKVIASAQEPAAPTNGDARDLLDETMASVNSKTGTGVVIGTPGYMSPEQVRGDPVDSRTDLFSLGAVLYELLAGRRAFPGASPVESGYAILHNEPEPLPATVPPAVAQVVRRCLEKDPARRFQSARDLAFHLEALRAPTSGTTVAGVGPAPRASRRRLGVAVGIGLLVVAGAFLAAGPRLLGLVTGGKRAASGAAGAQHGGTTPSIAVLPFVNLSPDKEQEYFSDGITEELLDALARVKGLKVAGRTSSFHFKGKNEDLRTIGETLGVANIVEGSVRKQGNRVRITAQLIQVSDGFHRWSRTFDGDLTDVFDLQEKIARSITDELKVVLQGDPQNRLVPVATTNPEAYSLYLQATAIFNRRDGARFPDAIAQVQQALRLDPGYARGWSRLATLWVLTPIYRPGDFNLCLAEAEKAAHRAIELDSSLGEPHAVLGLDFVQRRQLLESTPAFHRALELDPDDVTANFWFATTLVSEGYFRRANQVLDKVLAIDPMYPNGLNWRGLTAFGDGDLDLAERLARRSRDAGLAHAGLSLSYVAEARGQHEEAIAQLTAGLSALSLDLPQGFAELTARGALGDVQARERALALIKGYLATGPAVVSGPVPYALMRLGRPAEALEILERGPTGNDSLAFPTTWLPAGRATRTLPEFSEAARRIGLTAVWEREGAPDLCQRVAPGKYVCR